jgi:MSHA biogenesis protein MshO
VKSRKYNAGFTLIEAVVAMTIGAIVIGFAALMVTAPVNSYLDQSGRAELNDAVDIATRLLDDDLRRALPNSVSIRNAGNRSIVEMLIVNQVAFYRIPSDFTPNDPARGLDFSGSDDRFTAFGIVDANSNGFLDPANSAEGRLVIANMGRGTGSYNAYQAIAANGAMLPANRTVTITRSGGEENLALSAPFQFADPASVSTLVPRAPATILRNRMFVVSGAVTYICNTGANTRALRRFEGYGIRPNIATSEASLSAGTSTLVASNVTACQFSCNGNTDVCLRTLVVQMDFSRTSSTGGNERIRLHRQYSMDNDL